MKILVVDDSKTVRFVMLKMLKELGYKDIEEAADVNQAWMKINISRPDLIISDWNMPGKSGFDFLVEIRSNEKTKNIPFIMSTTVKDKDDIFQAIKAGLQAYLIKPCQKDALAEKICAIAKRFSLLMPEELDKNIHWTDSGGSAQDGAEISREDQVQSVADHFRLVVHGELSFTDFRDWLAHDLLNFEEEESKRMQKADQFIEQLQDATGKAIRDLMKNSDLL